MAKKRTKKKTKNIYNVDRKEMEKAVNYYMEELKHEQKN